MRRALDILTTCPEYGALCDRILRDLPVPRVRHWKSSKWDDIPWSRIARDKRTPLLIVSRLADFPSERAARRAQLGPRVRRHLIFAGDMPAESLPTRVSRLNIRDETRLHLAAGKQSGDVEAILRRILRAVAAAQDDRIVDAWREGDHFVVLSPSFRRLSVPLSELSKWLGNNRASIDAYQIDPDGSFVYWPHADVHLGWQQLLRIVDPAAALAARRATDQFNHRYGQAIRSVRREHGRRQSDIAGLTARQVGRIEKGECRATRSALAKLAKAHNLGLNEYLAEVAATLDDADPRTP